MPEATTTPKTNIVLIDFENVQPKDLGRLRGQPFKTKVFLGANQPNIPKSLAAALQPLGPDAEYIDIQGNGPNALDFHIAYYIGRLSAECPHAGFYIISKDKGFDPLIKHLAEQHIECKRLSSLADIPVTQTPPPKAPLPACPQTRTQRVADGLLTRKEARPRTLKTLTAFIKSHLGSEATVPAISEVLTHLAKGGMLTQPDGKLTYPPH